ncbi:MAG: [Fe-Fe] hydrogenase large subunit C-terminal domain-containing protein [Solidesulfovibrio sp. DCME]|uniref:[Fe-Fe] hydrogenase large subunit C-terminal domain-containing protein n=1 Tax=Solidesulfovibrio sp. DCME TaxID=3447380 RepID=UPI003D148E77
MPASVKEPLFAAFNRGDALRVKDGLADKGLFSMVQCAPAVRVSIAEEFGLPLGSLTPGRLAAALRRLGFDRVYDTNFTADLTIMEEGTELIQRVTEGGTLPMFTSCCPAWVKYLEQTYPALLPNLSSCKSPQQMAGALFKTYSAKVDGVEPQNVFSVSIMPCTCKKFESERPEMESSGYRDVDVVLTTRELGYLIKDAGIDFADLPDEAFDKPLGVYTGAGNIFGATGGVMEAALRTGYELITKEPVPSVDMTFVRGGEGVRKATVKVGKLNLKVAVVSGLANVAARRAFRQSLKRRRARRRTGPGPGGGSRRRPQAPGTHRPGRFPGPKRGRGPGALQRQQDPGRALSRHLHPDPLLPPGAGPQGSRRLLGLAPMGFQGAEAFCPPGLLPGPFVQNP